MERHIKLDELGTFVIGQIDGKKTVRKIINAFAKHYKLNRRESELSCVAFIKSLTTRNVISVVIK